MEGCDWQCTREAVRKLEKALGCGVCDKLLREPCTLGSCDHLFCRSCIDAHLGAACPICHAPAWVKDLQLKRELASVVSLYDKLSSIISQDVEEGTAEVEEVTMAAGRHVEIEVLDPVVLDECHGDNRTVVVMEMEDVADRRKALRPRNVSSRSERAQSDIQKKRLKKSGPISSRGVDRNEKRKKPKTNEVSRRCPIRGNDKSKASVASSSSSENEPIDPMSVYDFVPSPKRPKPAAKKRSRKPNPKTVKRQRVTAANRRWLRGNESSRAGEESESGFDSERSLRHVSFSIDVDQSKSWCPDSSSVESMDVSSQDECPASVMSETLVSTQESGYSTGSNLHASILGDQDRPTVVTAKKPVSTQESGYTTGSNLDASSLGDRDLLSSHNGISSAPANSGGTLDPKVSDRQLDNRTPTKHSTIQTGQVSQPCRASSSDAADVDPLAITAHKRKTTRRHQDSAESANSNKQVDTNPMLPPNTSNARQRRGRLSSKTASSIPEKDAPLPPKNRPDDQPFDSLDKQNEGKSVRHTRNSNTTPENDLQTLQTSRQTRQKHPRENSAVPPSPRTSPTVTSSPRETLRGGKKIAGSPSSSEKHRSSKTMTTSPRNSCTTVKRNKRGETPLHIAAIKGDISTARQLLTDGADPNVKDNAGWTPLHEACNHGHASIVGVLLDHGALINTPGFEHDSPLHDAVMNHRLDVVKLLLQRGASLQVRNMHGFTPADYAKSDPMRKAMKTKALVAMPASTVVTASQKSLLGRSQPVVLLGTGLKDAEKKQLQACAKLLGAGRVVRDFGPEVTHLVASCNHDNLCMRTIKYLNAILNGVWVVSFEWITECLTTKARAPEIEFEVKGTTTLPSSAGAEKGRKNAEQQLPGLLDGCHFYLHSTFSPPTPSKQEIVQLVKNGGGTILARQPKPDDDIVQASTTIPYHMREGSELANCSYYFIHDHVGSRAPPRVRTGKLCTAPVSWLMDCISQFELLDLPN